MASLQRSSFHAVQQFSATASKQCVRRLHMTGANSTPSRLMSKDPASNLVSRSLKDLRDECKLKNISANGGEAEVRGFCNRSSFCLLTKLLTACRMPDK